MVDQPQKSLMYEDFTGGQVFSVAGGLSLKMM